MAYTVAAPKRYAATVHDNGDELVLRFACCGGIHRHHLQRPPWSVPVDPAAADYGSTDGHEREGFAEFEQARTAGRLEHRDVDALETVLYCPRCERQTDVRIEADK